MTPKSYITLCIIACIYVLMAAVAVISPHGSRFAEAQSNTNTQDTAQQNTADDSEPTPEPEPAEPALLFTNAEGVKVYVLMSGMSTFASTNVTVTIDGQEKTYTAVHFKSLVDYSGLSYNSDWIVFKGKAGKIFACRAVDLQKDDNAYVIYADENGQPLDENTLGNYCLYVREGSRKGFFDNVSIVDFG